MKKHLSTYSIQIRIPSEMNSWTDRAFMGVQGH